MSSQPLKLKFKEEDRDYSFNNGLSVVNNKKLIENLGRINIKNEDSSLMISSMNDLHISDVIQIKINVAETGVFLVNFEKENIDEEKRKEILEKIGTLKDDVEPTVEIQTDKIKKLLNILNEFNPIYVTFSNKGDIKIPDSEISDLKLKFPLLVLRKKEKERPQIIKIKKNKPNAKTKEPKGPREKKILFKLFDVDYVFVGIFSLLTAFGIFSGVFEVFNEENLYVFLFILSVVFFGVTCYAAYTTLYKKGQEKYKGLRYYLCIFIMVGVVVGLVLGYVISKNVLKTEIENYNYKKNLLIAGLSSLGASLLSIPFTRLINIFVKNSKK